MEKRGNWHWEWMTVFLALSVLFSVRGSGWADVIQTETTLELIVMDKSTRLCVKTLNLGPSVMYDLKIRLEDSGQKAETLIRPQLNIHETNRVDFDLKTDHLGKGTYPLVVRTDGRDRAGLPVSTCDVILFPSDVPQDPELDINSEPLTLDTWGHLNVDIRNRGHAKKNITVRVLAPDPLGVDDPVRDVVSEPEHMIRVHMALLNRYASVGDAYPVFCIAEYDQDQVHYASVKKVMIHISDTTLGWHTAGRVLWLLVVCSGLLWIGTLVEEHRKKGRAEV